MQHNRRSGGQREVPATPRKTLKWVVGIVGGVVVIGIIALLSATGSEPRDSATGDAAPGAALFNANCAGCHGIEAAGSPSGPPLIHEYYVPGHHADAAFLLAIRNGVRPHHWDFGAMPAIRGLSDDDVDNIVAYVRSLQRSAGLIGDGS